MFIKALVIIIGIGLLLLLIERLYNMIGKKKFLPLEHPLTEKQRRYVLMKFYVLGCTNNKAARYLIHNRELEHKAEHNQLSLTETSEITEFLKKY